MPEYCVKREINFSVHGLLDLNYLRMAIALGYHDIHAAVSGIGDELIARNFKSTYTF